MIPFPSWLDWNFLFALTHIQVGHGNGNELKRLEERKEKSKWEQELKLCQEWGDREWECERETDNEAENGNENAEYESDRKNKSKVLGLRENKLTREFVVLVVY